MSQVWCGFCETTHEVDKHKPQQEAAVPPTAPSKMAAAYRVEVSPRCGHCNSRNEYRIVHTATDTEISQSFDGDDQAKEAAEDLCELLNRAVELERELSKSRRKVWTVEEIAAIYIAAYERRIDITGRSGFAAIAAKFNEVAD